MLDDLPGMICELEAQARLCAGPGSLRALILFAARFRVRRVPQWAHDCLERAAGVRHDALGCLPGGVWQVKDRARKRTGPLSGLGAQGLEPWSR